MSSSRNNYISTWFNVIVFSNYKNYMHTECRFSSYVYVQLCMCKYLLIVCIKFRFSVMDRLLTLPLEHIQLASPGGKGSSSKLLSPSVDQKAVKSISPDQGIVFQFYDIHCFHFQRRLWRDKSQRVRGLSPHSNHKITEQDICLPSDVSRRHQRASGANAHTLLWLRGSRGPQLLLWLGKANAGIWRSSGLSLLFLPLALVDVQFGFAFRRKWSI